MDEIDTLVDAIRQSARYRTVCPDLIAHVGTAELARRRSFKEAVKATKSKLHQAAGSYLDTNLRYGSWLDALREARSAGDEDAFRSACREIMRHQSSTRERLPILADFYTQALAPIAPVRTVLDIACGLNPLSIPWMPLQPGAEYWAFDVYEDLIDFLDEAVRLSGVVAHASCRDVTRLTPTGPADLALILKAVPCLDHLDRSAVSRLLDVVDARHLLISFPVRSLGGREKGMMATYEARMERLLAGRTWQVRRLVFPTELAFLVSR
jgi:16S rRNA (guanine(1405)-N(7))-methyltransferase